MAKTNAEKAVSKVLEDLPIDININELYNQFLGMTNIERACEEELVLSLLLKGKSRNFIIETLRAKHPEGKFTEVDFEKFLARNKQIVVSMGHEVTLSAQRHLAAKAHCAEMLAGVALYTQKLIQDFRSEGDNTNTVGAIRALNQTLESYMKLEGMTTSQSEGGKVINVIQNLSDGKSRLRDKVHNANFVYDISPEKESND